MVLVVAAGFVAAGAVQDAFLGREIARQADGALIVEPGVEAFLGILVIAAALQVRHHHARFIAVSAVRERADTRKAAGAVGLALAVDQQVPGVGAVKLVEDWLGGDELCALFQSAPRMMPFAEARNQASSRVKR